MSDSKAEMNTPSVADRSEEFVAVSGGQETSSAEGLLTVAYILMWAAVFAFIWVTSRRLEGLKSRVVELEGALKQADQDSAGGKHSEGS